jgi:hypothetical protein
MRSVVSAASGTPARDHPAGPPARRPRAERREAEGVPTACLAEWVPLAEDSTIDAMRHSVPLSLIRCSVFPWSRQCSEDGVAWRCDPACVMRVTITCEECGERHRLERRITEPGPIWIICHNCELPLQAVLEGPTPAATAPAPKPTAWSGVVDFSSAV